MYCRHHHRAGKGNYCSYSNEATHSPTRTNSSREITNSSTKRLGFSTKRTNLSTERTNSSHESPGFSTGRPGFSTESKLCSECNELLDYAVHRLSHCPHGDRKPTCRKCPIHCYNPTARLQIARVMRWSGKRMILHHPIAAIRHLLSEITPGQL